MLAARTPAVPKATRSKPDILEYSKLGGNESRNTSDPTYFHGIQCRNISDSGQIRNLLFSSDLFFEEHKNITFVLSLLYHPSFLIDSIC